MFDVLSSIASTVTDAIAERTYDEMDRVRRVLEGDLTALPVPDPSPTKSPIPRHWL